MRMGAWLGLLAIGLAMVRWLPGPAGGQFIGAVGVSFTWILLEGPLFAWFGRHAFPEPRTTLLGIDNSHWLAGLAAVGAVSIGLSCIIERGAKAMAAIGAILFVASCFTWIEDNLARRQRTPAAPPA
ncbi:MAG: hypothetical protein QM766_03800 [Burkholderiaceae bacterium]